MRTFKLSRAPVLACGALAVSLAVAGPAIATALDQGGGNQPPPGAPAIQVDTSNQPDSNSQPPAGAKPVKLEGVATTPVTQPANANPVKAKPIKVKNTEPDAKPHPGQTDNGTAVSAPE